MLTSTHAFAANPFAMLLDPAGVAHEVACSERLARLRSRVYRLLDKPLIARVDAADGRVSTRKSTLPSSPKPICRRWTSSRAKTAAPRPRSTRLAPDDRCRGK